MTPLSRALSFAIENPYSDFYRKKYGAKYHAYMRGNFSSIPPLVRDDIDAVPLYERIFVPKEMVHLVRSTSGSSGRRVTGFPMVEEPDLVQFRISIGFTKEEAESARYFSSYFKMNEVFSLLLFSLVGVVHEVELSDVNGGRVTMVDIKYPELTARLAKEAQADAIFIFPSPLLLLAPELTRAGVAGQIKLILLVGERMIESQRLAIVEAFPDARIENIYASTESQGIAAQTCPLFHTKKPNLIHPNNTYLFELLPSSGDESLPLSVGQEGEVVLTTLLPVVFPLIRFRTGDYAVVRQNGLCACGSPAPLVEILGRVELDRIKIPFGGISVAALEEAVRSLPLPVRDFSAVWIENETIPRLAISVYTDEIIPSSFADIVAKALKINSEESYFAIWGKGAVGELTLAREEVSSLEFLRSGKRKRLHIQR